LKKNFCILSVVLIIILCTPFLLSDFGSSESEEDIGKAFLESYGWVIGELSEKEQLSIPSPLNDVYINYNKIQLSSGFDLIGYCGECVTRYTYEIKNHRLSDNAYANVLIHSGKVIAADIMTRELNGFMHEINRKEYIN